MENPNGEIGGISTGQNLLEEFYHEKFDEYDSRLKSYQDQLALTDKTLSDASLISQLTNDLSRDYDDIVTNARSNSSLTYMHALNQLIDRETKLGQRRQSKALISHKDLKDLKDQNKEKGKGKGRNKNWRNKRDRNHQNRSRDRPTCFYCCKKGHTVETCFLRKRALELIHKTKVRQSNRRGGTTNCCTINR